MNPSILNKLSPEGREEIIRLEGKLREIQEQKQFLNKLENGESVL